MQALDADGLRLDPLTARDAEAMFALLSDPAIYRYLDESPPASVAALRQRYERLEARQSPDGRQGWLNWVMRPTGEGPAGYVQVTVVPGRTAWLAYVLGSAQWGRGLAARASRAVMRHVEARYGVERWLAMVEAENLRSIAVLDRLGFRPATAEEQGQYELTASERLFVRAEAGGAG